MSVFIVKQFQQGILLNLQSMHADAPISGKPFSEDEEENQGEYFCEYL